MSIASDPHSPSRDVRMLWLLVALALPTVVTWLYFVALAGASPALQQGAYTGGKAMQFALPVVWLLILRQPIRLRWPGLAGVGIGLAFGAVLLVSAWAAYQFALKPMGLFDAPSAAIREKIRGMGLGSLPAYVGVAVFYALLHSLLEEYYWRWFVFGKLCRDMQPAAAIAVSSLGFAAHHVLVLAQFFGWQSPATYLFAACVAIGGVFWAWLYRRSGSLLGPWLSHALVDAAIFVIGYDLARDLFVR